MQYLVGHGSILQADAELHFWPTKAINRKCTPITANLRKQ
jgi:hypothetical protein